MAASADIPSRLFDGAANPMLLLDDQRQLRAANRAWATTLGHELLPSRFDHLLRPAEHADFDQAWQSFLNSGAMLGRAALLHADGDYRPYEYNATARVGDAHLLILLAPLAQPGFCHQACRHLMDGIDNVRPDAAFPLSPREEQVMKLLVEGWLSSQIALHLGISEQTVVSHVSAIKRKLGARTRAHAVALALRGGVVPLMGPDTSPPGEADSAAASAQ